MSNLSTDVVHTGDAFDVLDELPAESVHAVVTDPPYGLNFMGRDWDNFRRRHNEDDVGRDNVMGRMSSSEPAHGAETDMREYQKWCRKWAENARRVLKPGGHLLAFSGNRTHHRLFSGVEDAGFEIRDTLTWHYGSGFPKALSVEQEIDWPHPDPETYKHHSGSKTTLKPATEYVVMARKPLVGTVAENVQKHGTGALNIDDCRVEADEGGDREGEATAEKRYAEDGGTNFAAKPGPRGGSSKGRYPSNVVFDETAAGRLDREVGELSSGELKGEYKGTDGDDPVYGEYGYDQKNFEANSGGPSRYFYTSKATKAERTLDGRIENAHPTVKPQDLMEWLVKLVTRAGQVVLDPFAGTGTTCMAAKELGREFIGIEKQPRWADVARVRCNLTPDDPGHVRGADDAQTGLEAFADGGSQNHKDNYE